MDYLCEVHFNSQVRLQTQGGLSCGRLAGGWRKTRVLLLPRGSHRFIIGHPVSSRICLNRLGEASNAVFPGRALDGKVF